MLGHVQKRSNHLHCLSFPSRAVFFRLLFGTIVAVEDKLQT